MFLGGPDGSESTAQIGGDAAGGSSQSDSSANCQNGWIILIFIFNAFFKY
jgi:hypothetical protein